MSLERRSSRVEQLVVGEKMPLAVATTQLIRCDLGDRITLGKKFKAHKAKIWLNESNEVQKTVVNLGSLDPIKGKGRMFEVVHKGKVNTIHYKDAGRRDVISTKNTGSMQFVLVGRKASRGTAYWAFFLP